MRTFIKTAVICGLLLGTATPMFANSGSAVLAHFRASRDANRFQDSGWYVSNVSSRDVQVTLTLFDQNGDPIGAGTFNPVITATGAFTNCNGTNTACTLPAGKTGRFVAAPSAGTVDWFGHGTLEWSTSGTDGQPVSLTATAFTTTYFTNGNVMQVPLPVIKTQPF